MAVRCKGWCFHANRNDLLDADDPVVCLRPVVELAGTLLLFVLLFILGWKVFGFVVQ